MKATQTKTVRPDVTPAAGLPSSFFWLAAISVIVALLFPIPPIKYLLIAVFGTVYLSFLFNAPERALFVFILGMPAIVLVPENLLPIPALNPETLAILSLGLAAAIGRGRQPQPLASNPFVAPVVYYVAILSISALFSFWAGTAKNYESGILYPLGAWELFAGVKNQVFFVLLGPIAFRLLWKREYMRAALQMVAVSTLLVSLHSLWLLRDRIATGSVGGSHRAVGLVAIQPNLFGGFVAIMVVMLLPLMLGRETGRRDRILYIVSGAAASTALLYTFSRGAWLAAIAGMVIVGFLRGVRTIAGLMIVGLVATFMIPGSAIDRAQSTFEAREEDELVEKSARTRVEQWAMLPSMLLETPVLGRGFKTFQEYWGQVGPEGRPRSAHSSIVEIGVEEGLLGLAAYAWLVWTMARGGLRLRHHRRHAELAMWGSGIAAAVVCLVLLDASGTRFRSRGVTGYLWILAGGVARMAAEHPRDNEDDDTDPRRLPPRRLRRGSRSTPVSASRLADKLSAPKAGSKDSA